MSEGCENVDNRRHSGYTDSALLDRTTGHPLLRRVEPDLPELTSVSCWHVSSSAVELDKDSMDCVSIGSGRGVKIHLNSNSGLIRSNQQGRAE